MERTNLPKFDQIDPKSGFNRVTRTFHSLRSPVHLPPIDTPLSLADYAFSLRRNTPFSDTVALIKSSTAQPLLYSQFIHSTQTLAANLRSVIGLSKGDVAFVLSPNLIQVPILYFALLSLGVVISPANPASAESEISRLVKLCKPVIAFATSSSVQKVLPQLRYGTILIDSPEFDLLMVKIESKSAQNLQVSKVKVSQKDLAAIMYSSGTTGQVKGVMLTHRNLIATVTNYYVNRQKRERPAVILSPVPYFHAYGLSYSVKSVCVSETVVVVERFDLKKMLRAVEEFRVTHLAVVPPIVVAWAKDSSLTDRYDLTSLEALLCGAAPLGQDTVAAFTSMLPGIPLHQGYGLTESAGAIFRMLSPEEARRLGTVGRLEGGHEARIVDPDTREALLPGQQGELWLRGPSIMKGYVDAAEATSETLLKDGWLRSGDLCYLDNDGFLHVVDRLKELIKYKGYQLAPAELEELLLSHPGLVDAAVVPYPDEEAGQVPMAFVVRRQRSYLDEAQVMHFVAKQVAPYKKVRRVEFVDSIPKNPAGKILRKELRNLVQARLNSKL